jgi:hypothetical protein
MNDIADPPPSARLVRSAQRIETFPTEATASEDSHVGIVCFKCSRRLRACLSELQPLASATTVVGARRRLRCVDPGRSSKPTLVLTAAFDAIAAGYPIEFDFGPESRFDVVDFSSSKTRKKRFVRFVETK